ncbi:CDP-alcohol phosphatidyltransferase family protein [Vibrio sp. LaRot3]|uniref:CDP-alcohol phosphatidyltransferase family protein n=1 Tax=Vibrio sp. LaRot3 TaxID=2998829 RepID=UPI0022CE21A8|nr:CDP-alcohol phosphatidyltransferase family protein [Vibrio sp. LaRot3]MDA0150556.1 CDP-alcohol phosphatidyltransferase family protein [Vibrio sp. LaRot3]
MSIYVLKSKFQNLLRPIVRQLYKFGVTANQVTLFAMLVSIAVGTLLALNIEHAKLFFIVPVWMFIRMALNAMDGMLAREFGQKSPLGAYFNELSDVIADTALFVPFALLVGVSPILVLSIIFLATLSEYTGALGLMVGADRRYDGPMGKSDRAFVFGALSLFWGLGVISAWWVNVVLAITLLLLLVTITNRIRSGIKIGAKNSQEA